MPKSPSFSFIAETSPAPAAAAHQHFAAKLASATVPLARTRAEHAACPDCFRSWSILIGRLRRSS
jgi:hypothetical protein